MTVYVFSSALYQSCVAGSVTTTMKSPVSSRSVLGFVIAAQPQSDLACKPPTLSLPSTSSSCAQLRGFAENGFIDYRNGMVPKQQNPKFIRSRGETQAAKKRRLRSGPKTDEGGETVRSISCDWCSARKKRLIRIQSVLGHNKI